MAFFGNNNSYIPPIDATSGVGAALSQNAATPPKRSFFGKLANALGNDDAQMNFAAAAAYASGKPEVAAQIIAAGQRRKDELQQYEQHHRDELNDWVAKQQYEEAHKEPETFELDGILYDKKTRQPIMESPYPKVYQGPNGFYVQPRIGYGRGGSGDSAPQGIPVGPGGQLPQGWRLDDGGAPQPGARPFPY
jgi:hypothetical protein